MGCCASAASQIQAPINRQQNGNQNKQINQNNDEEKSLHEEQNIQKQHQIIETDETPIQQKEQKEENIKKDPKDNDDQNNSPQKRKIREFIQKKKLEITNKPNHNSVYEELILDIENQILNQTFTLQKLQSISEEISLSGIEILCLQTQQGFTLLELVLIYIDNYEIIQHALLYFELPKNNLLLQLAQRIVNKMKPFRNDVQKIQQTIDFIRAVSSSEQIIEMLNQLHFTNFDTFIDVNDYNHLQLFKEISKLFFNSDVDRTYLVDYKTARNNYKFKESIVPKCIPLGKSDIKMQEKAILIHLQFNIFHQIALNKKWDQFLQYNNQYYYSPNIQNVTPFMMLFQSAPINIINKYLSLYPDSLNKAMKYSAITGKNLIHCLCQNPFIHTESEEITLLISELNKQEELLSDSLIQPYHDQIPLVYYLDSHKNPLNQVIEFLSQFIKKEYDYNQFTELQYGSKLRKLNERGQKFKFARIPLKKQIRFPQLRQKFQQLKNSDLFYYEHVQVAKQLIKQLSRKQQNIKIDWIKDFKSYCTFVPYDLGNVAKTLIVQLIENNVIDKAKEATEQFIKDGNENKVIYLFQLLQILQASSDPIKSIVRQEIKRVLSEDPQLLIAELLSTEQQEYLVIFELIKMNDQQLNDFCFNLNVQFKGSEKTALIILQKLYKLKLLFKFNYQILENIKQCLDYCVFITRKDNKIFLQIDISQPEETQDYQYHIWQVIQLLQDNLFKVILESLFSELLKGQPLMIEIKNKEINKSFIKYFFNTNDSYEEIQQLNAGDPIVEYLYRVLKINSYLCFGKKKYNQIFQFCWLEKGQELKEMRISLEDLTLEECEKLYDFELYHVKHYEICPKIKFLKPKNFNLQPKSFKSKVVIQQIVQGINFLQAMLIYPECLEDIKQNLKLYCSFKEYIICSQFRQMIANKAIINFQTLLQIEDFGSCNIFTFLIEFTKQHFDLSPKAKYNQQQLQEFNQQFQQLVESLSPNCLIYFNTGLWKDAYFRELILRIDEKSFILISQCLGSIHFLETVINQGLLRETPIQKKAIDFLFQGIESKMDDEVAECKIVDKKNKLTPQTLEYLIQQILKNPKFEENWGNMTFMLKRLFSHNPSLVIDYYCMKMQNSEEFLFPREIYEMALKNKDIKSLNKIIGNFKFEPILCQTNGKDEIEDSFINYIRATQFPYCLVLNLTQYKQVLEAVPQDEQSLIKQLITCIKSGQCEKVQFIIQKIGAFSSIKQKEGFVEQFTFAMLQLEVDNQLIQMLNFYLQPEGEFVDIQQYRIMTLQNQPYTLQRKQLKQKFSVEVLDSRAEESLEKSKKASQNILIRKEQLQQEFLKQLYLQNNTYSKQMQNQTCLFQPLVDYQEYNYDKCFELIKKWATHKVLTNISQQYEVVDALRYPGNKVVKQKDKLLAALAQAIEQRILNFKTAKGKLKDYMILIKANCSGQFKKFFNPDFAFYSLDYNTKLVFAQELIIEELKYDPSPAELDYLIYYLKIQNQKLVPILKKKFQGLKHFKIQHYQGKFGQSTLFYVKNGIDLLPSKQYDLTEIRNEKQIVQIERRMKFFCSYMSGIGIDIRKMTSDQVYLLFGNHDHITQKPQFSYGNLVLSFMSGKIETLQYMINLNQNPAKLVCEQNLFQLLIFEQFNDQIIINFFNKYIKDNQKFANRILYLGNVPLLYYIMLTKKERIFNECYMPQLIIQHGDQKALQILKEELIMEVGDKIDILTVALMKKNYYILNYCSGIIQPHHLNQITYYDIGNLENRKITHKDTIYGSFLELYQKLFPLCCQELKFQEYQKKFKRRRYENQKQMNLREMQLQQLILLERACVNKIFDLGEEFEFKNKVLTMKLAKDKWKIAEKFKFEPWFVECILNEYRDKDGNLNLNEEVFSLIMSKSFYFQALNHKIYLDLAYQNAIKFLDICSLQSLTIPLMIVIYQQCYRQGKSEELFDKIEPQTENDVIKVQDNIFVYCLMQLIYVSEFNEQYLFRKKLSVVRQTQRFLKQQDLSHQKKDKPLLNDQSQILIKKLLNKDIEFQEYQSFIDVIEKQESNDRALIEGIIYVDQINNNVKTFSQKLEDEIFTTSNFVLNYQIRIGEGDIEYLEDVQKFILPMQFKDGQFILSDDKIEKAIPNLKMTNFDKNLDLEKEDFLQLQEQYKDFDFSSITTIDFKEIIISEQGTNILKKCFFFQDLIERTFEKTGVYQIDDVFAPHQHEQIRQPELISQASQPPQLIHQSQSQIGISQSMRQQQSAINQQQMMKEDFQFMFELLPDNTYQVRQQKQKNQKELIFAEFYHFTQPQIIINLQKLTEEEFNTNYNGQTIITFIISDFYRYNEFLSHIIENKEQFKWNMTFPFYIKDQHFIYEEQLFSSYNIQMIFTKMSQFIEKVKFLLGRSEDESKLVWRINTISFLEVLVCKIAELNQKQNQKINVTSIMQLIFSWDTLIMILHQLLYNNLIKAQQVLKVIRGVYIEFNESQDIVFIQSESKKGLDRIFQFGNTTYLLYNHILIIRLNVGINSSDQYQKEPQKEIIKYKSVFKPDPQVQEYFHNIINEYDFFNQIFNPEQLIQYLFNKLEIDRQLLNYSNQLSKILNKTITLSVDHQSLAQIFSGEIQRINQNKNNKNRLKEMDEIWYILQKLNKYFKEDLFNYLQKQLRADRFDEMFNIRLFCLLSALRQNEPLINIISTNTRKLNFKEKSKILKKLSNPLSKSDIKLSYQFGFQVLKSFFVNNNKLGDICSLLYCENQRNNLICCQLVYNQKPGYFLFYKIDSMNQELQSQERMTRNQNYYSSIKQSNSDYVCVQIEDLISIIVFQPVWPSDPLFNSSILNVFFTDSDGRISLCNESKFQNLMNQIQNEQDEFNKQDMLDNLFGNGLVNSYSELSLTQFTPIFPDQINFDFSSVHQIKKQQSMVQGQNVFIRIFGDKFKLDPIDLASVSMACHFESHQKYQEIQKSFSKFILSNQEIQNIYLHFDDEMNNNAIYYTDSILITTTIFESFMQGYQLFKNSYSYPMLNNSLQYLFGISSLQDIKINFISSILERIEFIFQRNFGQETELIQYSNKTLKCYTLVNDNENVQVPDSSQIAHFLYDLILNYEKFQLNASVCEKNMNIKIGNDVQIENVKTIVDVILLSKYFYKIISLIDKNKVLDLQILNQNEINAIFKHSLYQFTQDGTLIFNYVVFQDFSLSDFFLDYLNNKQHHIKERYNERIQYIGPQIIMESFDLIPNKCLNNLQEQQQVEIKVYDSKLGLLENCNSIKANQFETMYLVFSIDGVYKLFQTVISQENKKLEGYFKQKSLEQTISNSLYLLIEKLNPNKIIDSQLSKIEWQEQKNKKTTLANYLKKEKTQENVKIKMFLVTNSMLLVEFFSDKVVKLSLSSQFKNLSMIQNQFVDSIALEYKTLNQQDLSKTTHISITFDNKTKQVQNEQEEQVSVGHGDTKLIKILMKKASQKTDEVLLHKLQEPISHSKELQLSNSINMLSKQEIAASTRAGKERIDEIEFRDNLDNKISNFTYSSIVFVHSLFYQIQYFPKEVRENDRLKLVWTPTFKGVYKLFIDDIRIKGRFVILANSPCVQECIIEMPQNLTTIPFYEIIPFTFQLKDAYFNIYGDIESEAYMDCKCEIIKSEGDSKLEVNFQNLAKGGSMNVNINFVPKNAEGQEEETIIQFLINKEVKIAKPIKISGVSLEKRRKRFDQDLNKSFKSQSYNLNIRRMNFLKDLLDLADKKMNYSFSIKFQDEPGIDAGGLKREFYDMIGNTLKDETYKFFQPVQGNLSKYFLHKNFNKLKNKEQYALLFGKLIANAIANQYLIGIDIISPFWKVVYNEKIVFEDLKIIWDKQTYENYENLLQMNAEMIDSLYLDFTYQIGNNTIELIPNGSKTSVTKDNVSIYLDKTAEYIIFKQFQDIYKSFIQGFTSVVDIKIFQKWLRPAEISLLTQGLLEIKPETILQKITYSGGKANHKSYFENYVTQADSQTLKNMLKFITGSSAIPYDQGSYIISVEFKNQLDIRKLPLAHTCFKSIEVPLYTNYGQMKQKLDIAFTIGLEGYGFG